MRQPPKQKLLYPTMLMLLLFFLALLFFYAQFRYNNKYTYPGSQPVNGILALSEDQLEENPLRYLINDWEFYPGELLSPEDLAQDSPGYYRQYVSIGQYSHLDGGNPALSGYGSGTYRLLLKLPDAMDTYALEFPEIFSSCRIYIDGRLAKQLGNPDFGRYLPGVKNIMLNFQAQGLTEILVAATDYSGVYSGMVYPPAFGLAGSVAQMRLLRLLAAMAVFFLAVFGALLSFYMGLRARWGQGILFSLLCLCFIGCTSYNLFHTIFLTAIKPWYAVEIFCYYAMLFFIVLLGTKVYGVPAKQSLCLCLPFVLGAVLAFLYAICMPDPTTAVRNGFSALSAMLKWGTAACLLAFGIHAIIKKKSYSLPLLVTLTVYAASLVSDRLLPLYEPIIGGWFGETGAAALILGYACLLWNRLSGAYKFRLTYAEEKRQMETQLSMQKTHYRRLSQQVEAAKKSSHDLRHHMRTLSTMAEAGSLEEIKKYLRSFQYPPGTEFQTYSGHTAADALISYYAATAREAGISFDAVCTFPEDLAFPDDELCVVLGNLIENALEACLNQTFGPAFVYLRGEAQGSCLRLALDNSFEGELIQEGNSFLSSKRKGSGMGISSVRAIVENHGGLVSFGSNHGIFQVSVWIPL